MGGAVAKQTLAAAATVAIPIDQKGLAVGLGFAAIYGARSDALTLTSASHSGSCSVHIEDKFQWHSQFLSPGASPKGAEILQSCSHHQPVCLCSNRFKETRGVGPVGKLRDAPPTTRVSLVQASIRLATCICRFSAPQLYWGRSCSGFCRFWFGTGLTSRKGFRWVSPAAAFRQELAPGKAAGTGAHKDTCDLSTSLSALLL